MNNTWSNVADEAAINKTIIALKKNGIDAEVVESKRAAFDKVFSYLPENSEVMTMTSVTLDVTGISDEINKDGGKFISVRNKLSKLDSNSSQQEKNKLGAAPQYVVGSVHAITQEGQVIIASLTGSQLPSYAYSAQNVIWVVGAQKIVKNLDEGMKRLYEYTLPLESDRAKKAYGVEGSFVAKTLVINKEIQAGRIKVIIVKENLGF